MAKYVVDRTPMVHHAEECEVVTYREKRHPERYITILQPGILTTEFLATYKSLGEAKKGHWQQVDNLLATGVACFDLDDAKFHV